MTRTESARNTSHTPDPGHACPLVRRRHVLLATVSLLLVLRATPLCAGASGPGLGIKAGIQVMEDPIDLDETAYARVDLEVASPLLWDEHVDFALTVGGSYLGSQSETYTDFVDDTYIDDLYTDRLWLVDIRLAARLYPLGASSRIRPYVGAGVGYFWFRDNWENEYSDTFERPPGSDFFVTVYDHAEGSATLASGFFPFFLAGLTFPIGDHVELMAEFQYDLDKKDEGFDLSGPIYMFGARFRF
jgi:hypothetical protein